MTEKAEILDDLDRKILSKLMADSSQAYSDIAKELFVSAGTVHVRMKKMIQLGVVKGEYLEVDYHKLGYDVTAFLGIFLDKSSMYDSVTEQLNKIPEVVEAHYTTGNYSIFVKVICRDTKDLKEVLTDRIQSIQGVQRTETLISLAESINRHLGIPDV
ncbi:MAG: Lrp/AsnC ligand binding domain-containing protein [Saprospiraceae bacterium]|jgi:Lrp/AsnC family transcriptional regulator for asnA, asnC and gidA|nr:Lrp/AsnC ligand binding domain-containing protein [Saprospiraceae bacterium]MBK6476879.1 Lrp/AsnC ligand binding domain-containing protein [Saprospiraceae bacterium]MBK6816094.1 Lrp/AsnC ligand binding domain-containing protein [Saprospiraceae bacterium]MBK7370209.1 Lrp/AsnC ligand binding domain-containing protein [Saprospiraceae bacterium]MBK7437916.1 Lrp/AsnC ligand binding domain-containing protein [Saprospiraceae bacterium]